MVDGEFAASGMRDSGGVGERFPFTKFLRPELDGRVHVEGTVGRLNDAVSTRRLTVVTAPAGAGKTTALAAWARTAGAPVVWIRMSVDDRSPPAAAAALLAGTRGAIEGFGSRSEQVLGNRAASPSPQHLVTSLVNDLGEGPAPVLILDDFHEVAEPDCLAFFDQLLDQLPPDVRVLIGTRSEPQLSLPRRRVRGEVAEFGLDDLRLDSTAIRRVIAGDAEVSDELVEAVAAASGGWAAAVRLATARLAADSEVVGSGAASSALTRLRSDLWRFLAEEVLDRQPDDVRRFLLETSVLDELSPAVCAAVTGREDSGGLLAELDKRNLFLARFVGRDGEVWRYHDLFATFLRDQLRAERSTDEIAALHRRAAAVLPPALAVPHLLAAGEHERVAELAIEAAFAHFEATTATVVAPWVEALPASVVDRDHRLPLLLAWRDELHGRGAEVLERLEPVHERLQAAGEEIAAAEIGLELAAGYMILGELERVGKLLEEADAQPLQGWWPLISVLTRMHWSRARGDWADATAAVQAAFDLTRDADDQSMHSLLAAALSSTLLFSDRGPAWLVSRTRQLAARLTASDTATRTSLRRILAGGALLRLDTDEAAAELRQCLTASRELGGLAWIHQEAEGLLLALSLGTGDHATVHAIVSEAMGRMEESPIDASLRFTYAYAALRADWLGGQRTQIGATAARLLPPRDTNVSAEEQIVRTLAEALTARADGRAAEALGPLGDAEALHRDTRCWLGAGLPGLERATILFEQGRTAAAIEAAEPTLAAATELGPGILLPEAQAHRDVLRRCAHAGVEADLIQAVLATVGRRAGATTVAVPGTGETLSPREVEVLAQVALGRSNREIAEALFVSEVTVKSHLTRILRKLDATSRTHAVARAREMHLL